MVSIMSTNYLTLEVDEYIGNAWAMRERERMLDLKRTKPTNNWASEYKRIVPVIKMLNFLGNIKTVTGAVMSAKNSNLINTGDMSEMVSREIVKRINGYEPSVHLKKEEGAIDFSGRGGLMYECKYTFSKKYRSTALNPNSPAHYVYLVSGIAEGVYKIPFKTALQYESVYTDGKKWLDITAFPEYEQYKLVTYTEMIFKHR